MSLVSLGVAPARRGAGCGRRFEAWHAGSETASRLTVRPMARPWASPSNRRREDRLRRRDDRTGAHRPAALRRGAEPEVCETGGAAAPGECGLVGRPGGCRVRSSESRPPACEPARPGTDRPRLIVRRSRCGADAVVRFDAGRTVGAYRQRVWRTVGLRRDGPRTTGGLRQPFARRRSGTVPAAARKGAAGGGGHTSVGNT